MRRILIFIFSVMCIISSLSVCADDESRLAATLMKVAGSHDTVLNLLEEIAINQVKETITLDDGGLSQTEKQIFLDQLKLDSIENKVIEHLRNTFDLAELESLLSYYEQPLLKKMLELKQEHVKSRSDSTSKRFLISLMNNMPSPRQIKLMHELVDVAMEVEQKVFLSAVITREKNKTPLEFYKKFGEEQAQRLDYYLESYKVNMINAIRPEMRLLYMRIYHSLQDEELERLIELLKDKNRMKYQAAFVDAVANVLSEGVKAGIWAILQHREKRAS